MSKQRIDGMNLDTFKKEHFKLRKKFLTEKCHAFISFLKFSLIYDGCCVSWSNLRCFPREKGNFFASAEVVNENELLTSAGFHRGKWIPSEAKMQCAKLSSR